MSKLKTRRLSADLAEVSAQSSMVPRPQMTVCATCGQIFDMRKLALAYHHDLEPHDPL